jgi:enoyl-CoA hydratase/carnithine racemase
MDAAFDAFAADDDRWVAIVTGAGVNAFRAGHISSSRQQAADSESTGRKGAEQASDRARQRRDDGTG